MSQSAATAWTVEISRGVTAAVGEFEMVHLVSPAEAMLFEIPCTPPWCSEAVLWNGEPLPLVDAGARLGFTTQPPADAVHGHYIGVLRFADHSGSRRFGALRLHGIPARLDVNDSDACELPESLEHARGLIHACFSAPHGGATPVLNLERLFGA